MEYLGLLLGAPFIWLMGTSSNLTTVYVALAAFGFFRGIYDSNLFVALFDVIPQRRYRSSATGLMLCCAFTVGATSPVLLGYVKQHISLDVGLSSLAFVYLLGGGADSIRDEKSTSQKTTFTKPSRIDQPMMKRIACGLATVLAGCGSDRRGLGAIRAYQCP